MISGRQLKNKWHDMRACIFQFFWFIFMKQQQCAATMWIHIRAYVLRQIKNKYDKINSLDEPLFKPQFEDRNVVSLFVDTVCEGEGSNQTCASLTGHGSVSPSVAVLDGCVIPTPIGSRLYGLQQ